jgi:hypothetical protein
MKLFLLKWLISWSMVIQGLMGVVTFGYINPRLTLKVSKVYARYLYRENKE